MTVNPLRLAVVPAMRGHLGRIATHRLIVFGAIGAVCTVAYAALYALCRHACGPAVANVLALIPSMALNFWANRAFTFRDARGPLTRQLGLYLVAYAIGIGASSLFFAILLAAAHPRRVFAEAAVGIIAGLAATVVRYVLMSRWVFVVDPGHHMARRAGRP
jgi:putative flippase GtrA